MAEPDTACCMLEEGGTRCKTEPTEQPFSFTKRLQRTAWGRHKIELDEKAGHTRLCPRHRELLAAMKAQIDYKRKKLPPPSADDGVVTVEFASLQMPTLKRYRKKFALANGQNPNKTELVAAIEKHFATLPVNEGKDILGFLKHVQKVKLQRQATATPDIQP